MLQKKYKASPSLEKMIFFGKAIDGMGRRLGESWPTLPNPFKVKIIIIVISNLLTSIYPKCRSSRQRFSKKSILKNFAIFRRKHLCWSLFGGAFL